MSNPTLSSTIADVPRTTRQRNFLVHTIDGGVYMGAVALVDANTVLPALTRELGAADWLIGLMPVLGVVGFGLASIFTAHRIDRLPRFKPLCLVTGIFQRLPYLAAGLLLLWQPNDRTLALAAVALAPLLCGLAGGLSFTAWLQLLSKTVSSRKRPAVLATRYVLAAIMGLLAGWVVRNTLAAYPGTEGIALLHLYAFALLMISYVSFLFIREVGDHPAPPEEHHGLWQNLRRVPGLLRTNRRLRPLLLGTALQKGGFIMIPFLAIHAKDTLGAPPSYLGDLLIINMIGAIAGNALAAWLGAALGPKRLCQIGAVLFIATIVGAWAGQSETLFAVVFVLFGLALFTLRIGWTDLLFTLCPETDRSLYYAITNLSGAVALIAAALLGATLWARVGTFAAVGIPSVATMLGLLVLLPSLYKGRHPVGV